MDRNKANFSVVICTPVSHRHNPLKFALVPSQANVVTQSSRLLRNSDILVATFIWGLSALNWIKLTLNNKTNVELAKRISNLNKRRSSIKRALNLENKCDLPKKQKQMLNLKNGYQKLKQTSIFWINKTDVELEKRMRSSKKQMLNLKKRMSNFLNKLRP